MKILSVRWSFLFAALALMSSADRAMAETQYEQRPPNAAYLRNLPHKPWWQAAFAWRVPVLVAEPVGLPRRNAPVNIVLSLPEKANPSAIRVVTPWGQELSSQAGLVESGKVEIVFTVTLAAYEQQPVFVYFGSGTNVPPAAYQTDLTVREKADRYELGNECLQVEFLKKPINTPEFARGGPSLINRIHIVGSPAVNELQPRQPGYAWAGHVMEGLAFGEGILVENGPVRATVEYQGKRARIRYSLYPFSRRIAYRIYPNVKPFQVRTHTIWLVGGDIRDESVYYESEKGVKVLPGTTANVSDKHADYPSYELSKWLKEGWLALGDSKGEIAGEFFERAFCHGCRADMLCGENLYVTQVSDQPLAGALAAMRGDVQAFRDEYAAWKNPPVALAGAAQALADIRPRVPRYDRDNIREYLASLRRDGARRDERTADELVRQWQSYGANSVKFTEQLPIASTSTAAMASTAWLGELIAAAHARGMAVRLWPHGTPLGYQNSTNWCPFENSDPLVRENVAEAGLGLDLVFIDTAGEVHLPRTDEHCRRRFKERHGLDMPQLKAASELWKGAPYGQVKLDMEDEYTRLTKDLAGAVRKIRPDVPLGILCSSSGDAVREVDIEAKAPYVNTLETEIISGPIPELMHTKQAIRLPLGVFGNRGVSLQHHFYFWQPNPLYRVSELEVPLMFGIKSFCKETFSLILVDPAYIETVGGFYKFLDYTGLERFLPGSSPVKFIAVFRDYAAYRDDWLRGDMREVGGLMGAHDSRGKEWSALKALPMDIVTARFFTPAELSPYKLLIIPNDRVLSEAHAAVVEEYVRAGGCLLTEGETVNQPLIAKLAGVTKTGEANDRITMATDDPSLPALKITLPRKVKIKTEAARPLARDTTSGEPAIVWREHGKGKVVYSTGMISDDLGLVKEKAQLARGLIEWLAGKGPVYPPAELEDQVEANLLVNGDTCLVGVYNPDSIRPRVFNLTVAWSNGFGLNLTDGAEFAFAGQVPVKIGPFQVKFYLLGPKEKADLPAATACAQSFGYSAAPGMRFFEKRVAAYPRRSGAEKVVGVFRAVKTGTQDYGAEGIYAVLTNAALPGVITKYLDDLDEASLTNCDVVVVPNMGQGLPRNLSEGWGERVRQFVEQGRSALLCDHATGFGQVGMPPFPEVGRPNGRYERCATMRAAKEHPVTAGFKVGEVFTNSAWDYKQMTAGERGEVVVEGLGEGGTAMPAAVVGKVGLGRVVLYGAGMGSGYEEVQGNIKRIEKAPADGERRFLLNAIKWLGDEGIKN